MMSLTLGHCVGLVIFITGTYGHSNIRFDDVDLNILADTKVFRATNDEPKQKLSQMMWNGTLDIALKAYKTAFVQGLRNGTLSPTKFGAYELQDAVYLEKQSDAFMIASQNELNMKFGIQFQEFLIGQARKYTKYATDMYDDWHLIGSSCLKLDSACEAYVDYKIEVAKTMDLPYTIIAMIPCLKLWPWLGQKFMEEGHTSGVYSQWVSKEFNASYVGYEVIDYLVDELNDKGWIEENKAMEVYTNCMNGEFLFFDHALA